MELYLSQYLGIEPGLLADFGAIDISVVSDLPLFIDPFLLFHSTKPEYQDLHERILTYLRFLRDKAADGDLEPGLIASWYKVQGSQTELARLYHAREWWPWTRGRLCSCASRVIGQHSEQFRH